MDPLDSRAAIDLRRLFGVVWQYRWIVLGITALCVLIAVVASLLMLPRYTASASMQIDQEEQRILDSQDASPNAAYQDADRFLRTIVDVLRSERMAERVAEELDLFEGDAFFEIMQVDPPEDEGPQQELARRELILDTINDNLSINLPTDSRVVTVSFTSPDRAFSARFANTFVTNFLRYNIERRLDRTVYARDFLSQQLEDARQRLERAEREANDYARSTGLVRLPATVPGGDDTTITTINLATYNQALNDARTARVAAQTRWNQVSQVSPFAIVEVVNNKALQDLISARAVVNAQVEAELVNKQRTHPTVVPLLRQQEEYDSQIATLASGIRNSIRNEYRIAQERENDLQGRVSALTTATQGERDTSVQLNTLNREVDTSRQLYDALLQRYQEMSAEANITSNNVQQIDVAEPPIEPSSPRVLLNVALGLLAGIALSALYVFLREQMDDRIHSPDELQSKLGLKLLGVTPLLPKGESPVEKLQDPKTALSESLYSVRTALQFATPEGRPKRLMVTSAQASEGKSSMSYGIARTFAEAGKSVLLIDCDMRKPTVHRNLDISNRHGLIELLGGDKSYDEVIQATGIENFSAIPLGQIPANPTDILASRQFSEALDVLNERFDLLMVDAPPVLGLADAVILSAHPGMSTVFVVQAGRSHYGTAKGAVRRLIDNGGNMIGGVLTQFDFDAARVRGLGDSYTYGQGYSYYEYGS
ncbi:hypothetical protein A3711_02830 [Erythrobacter sp. HI00D59]|nr:hypothetical protein A3711_02830 [Erythrobacter sp. HI00D59]